MKVLVRNEPNWVLKVECKKSDWQEDKLNCGSILEVDKEDVVYRDWSKYPFDEGRDFGVICPVCDCFAKISKDELPVVVMSKSKNYLDVIKETKEEK